MRRGGIPILGNGDVPGNKGHIFLPGGGYPPGSVGQFTELEHDFRYVADPRSLANGLYNIDVPTLLWVAGDANNPTVGPLFTATGAPANKVSPYQTADGSDVQSEKYPSGSYRHTATNLDPSAGEDVVWFGIAIRRGAAAADAIGGNWSTKGVTIYTNGINGVTLQINGDTQVLISSSNDAYNNSLFMWHVIIDRSANIHYLINGALIGTNACPLGALGISAGFGLAATAAKTLQWLNGELLFQYWCTGNAIADKWIQGSYSLVTETVNRFFGMYPIQGSVGSFSRNSAIAFYDRNGRWHIGSKNMPCSGDSEGLLLQPQRQNDTYNNVNPQVTTGWLVTGGTHTSAIDDSTALEADNLEAFGEDVHRFVPGGADQVIYGGAQNGNTNAHCLIVAIRGSAGGESVDIGLRDASSGVVQNLQTIVCTTSYQVVIVKNKIPSDTDMQWCLDCDSGDTIYFIASQLEEGAVPTTPIPNWQTAATATRAQDVLDLAFVPSNTEGSIELTVTPVDWSGAEAGTQTILTRATGAPALLQVLSGTWQSALDGTTVLNSAVAPSDGVTNLIRLRWTGSSMSIDVDGTRVSGAYDGSLAGSGVLRLVVGAPVRIKSIRAYRNGDG